MTTGKSPKPEGRGPSLESTARRWLARARGHGPGALLLRGASGSFIAKGLAAVAGFGLHVVLARMLGATPYGDFTYAFTWMVVLASLARMGMDQAVLRYIPGYEETRRWGGLRGILRSSNRWVWLTSAGVAALALPIILWWSRGGRPELTLTFLVGLACLPLIASIGIRQAQLAAFKHPVLATIPFPLIRPALTLPIFVVGALLISAPSAPLAMIATGAGTLGALVFTWGAIRRLAPPDALSSEPDTQPRREWLDTALPLMWAATMTMIAQRASMLLTGVLAGTEAVAFLSAAMRYSDLLLFAQQAVASLATPMFAGMFAGQRHRELQRTLSLSTLAAVGFAFPLGLSLLIFRTRLLGVFGPAFESASPALIWLTAGQLVNVSMGLVAALLSMTGHHRVVAKVVTAAGIVGVLLNLLLIPPFGVTGAAAATACTIAGQNIALAIVVFRELRLNATVLGAVRLFYSR